MEEIDGVIDGVEQKTNRIGLPKERRYVAVGLFCICLASSLVPLIWQDFLNSVAYMAIGSISITCAICGYAIIRKAHEGEEEFIQEIKSFGEYGMVLTDIYKKRKEEIIPVSHTDELTKPIKT